MHYACYLTAGLCERTIRGKNMYVIPKTLLQLIKRIHASYVHANFVSFLPSCIFLDMHYACRSQLGLCERRIRGKNMYVIPKTLLQLIKRIHASYVHAPKH
jgi:hypothetical protein